MQSQGAIALVCGILALATGLSNAFVVTPPLSRASFGVSASSGMTMKWDGQSMPKKNPKIDGLSMDASWARQEDRDDVWDGKPNPTKFDWEDAFLPSDEEVEAAAAGFDWAAASAKAEAEKKSAAASS